MAYTKFWKIGATGSYVPASNKPIAFDGTMNASNSITNVSSGVIAAINAIGTGTVSLQTGLPNISGTFQPTFTSSELAVTNATGTTITLAESWTGSTGTTIIYYFDKSKPANHRDLGINAIMGLASSPAAFSFVDVNNNIVNIPAGAIKQGEIYEFKINTVLTVTPDQILGLGV